MLEFPEDLSDDMKPTKEQMTGCPLESFHLSWDAELKKVFVPAGVNPVEAKEAAAEAARKALGQLIAIER